MFLKALPELKEERLHSNGALKKQGENPDFDPGFDQPFNTHNVNANPSGPSVASI